MSNSLTSLLAPHLAANLAHRQALGLRGTSYRYTLGLLDRYLVARGVETLEALTPALIDSLLASRTRRTTASFNGLQSDLSCFFRWLVAHEIIPRSPVTARRRRTRTALRPFLFDPAGARQLLAAARQLQDAPGRTGRATIYPMLFLLLYALGLRVGEASRLRVKDVDLQRELLEIYNAKFGKDRLVPFGPKVAGELRRFLEWRATQPAGLDPGAPLFTFDHAGRASLCPTTVTRTFKTLMPLLNLPRASGCRSPNPQCLRHSFAVGVLRRWLQAGTDPHVHLLQLSTYLGHVHPASTAIYLTITDELLDLASHRFATLAQPLLRRISL
jgi:site-specific recombinase XerD